MKVYKTINKITGKIYIGITNGSRKKYLGSGILLNVDIKRFGRENFYVETLEDNLNIEQIEEKEKYWISYYNSTDKNIGYNLATGGSYRKKVPKEKLSKILKQFYKDFPEKRMEMSRKIMGTKTGDSDSLRSESLKRYWKNKKKNVIRKKSENGSISKQGEKNPMFGKSGNLSPTSIKFSDKEIKFIIDNITNYTLKDLLEHFKKHFNRNDIKSVKPIRRILRENNIV